MKSAQFYSVYNSKAGLTLSIERMRRNGGTTTIIWPTQNCYDLEISFQAVYHGVNEWYILYTPFVCNTWLERLPGRLIDDIVYQPNEEFATRYLQNQLILQLLSRYPRMFHLRRCVSVSKFLANLKPKRKPARGRFTVCSEIDYESSNAIILSRTDNATMKSELVISFNNIRALLDVSASRKPWHVSEHWSICVHTATWNSVQHRDARPTSFCISVRFESY